MSTLQAEDVAAMRAAHPPDCPLCRCHLQKNFCNECDEYFNDGHAGSCPELSDPDSRADHRGHRTHDPVRSGPDAAPYLRLVT